MRISDFMAQLQRFADSGKADMFSIPATIGSGDLPEEFYRNLYGLGDIAFQLVLAAQETPVDMECGEVLEKIKKHAKQYISHKASPGEARSIVDVLYICALWSLVKPLIKPRAAARHAAVLNTLMRPHQERFCELVGSTASLAEEAAMLPSLTGLFAQLKLLQRVLGIPVQALTQEQAGRLASSLCRSAEIEVALDNRLRTDLPTHTDRIRESSRRFRQGAMPEASSILYRWNELEGFESSAAEELKSFCRAARLWDTLTALQGNDTSNRWRISTNLQYNAGFNSRDLHKAHAHLAVAKPGAPDQEAYGHLFLFNYVGGDSNDMPTELRHLISSPPFAHNPLHQITLLHLFFPYYVAGLQFNRASFARRPFSKAADKLHDIFVPLAKYDLENMHSVSVRLESAWDSWAAPVGTAYHLLMILGNELLKGTTEDAARLLKVRCGNGREEMLPVLSRSHVHTLFSDCARDIKSWTRDSFAQAHYEEFGLIVTEKTVGSVRSFHEAILE
jgi:hypothetical protein